METTFAPDGLDPSRSALVMIEFQREWLDEGAGKLNALMEDRSQFAASREGGLEALRAAREGGMHVAHVPCLFEDGYPEIGGGGPAGLFRAIPQARTWTGEGRPFAGGFEPQAGEFVAEGRVGASAFAHSNLGAYLRGNGIERLFLSGYALHVCVESTLREAHDRGYDAFVVEDATSAFTAGQRRHVLQDVVHHFGRRVTADALAEELAAGKKGRPHPAASA